MKSDIIQIDNHCNGFGKAVEETRKVAVYQGLTRKQSLSLELCTEEMLSMVCSITGDMKASFWLENEGSRYELHLSTRTLMDKEKRKQLIAVSTEKKNAAATTFLGRVRDVFEAAMTNEHVQTGQIPDEIMDDLANHVILEETEWDGYECAVLKTVSENVQVVIRGNQVEMIVTSML